MYNWDNYDNDIAYSYDDYVEEKDQYEDYILHKQLEEKAEEKIETLEYESKMAEQLIDSIYDKM